MDLKIFALTPDDIRLSRRPAVQAALPDRRTSDRGGLAPFRHPDPVRFRLFQPLQVQHPPYPGLPQPVELHSGPLPNPGRGRSGRHRRHQKRLLRGTVKREPDRHRPDGTVHRSDGGAQTGSGEECGLGIRLLVRQRG